MNKLIVTAHPSSKGFTHRIAQMFRKGAEEAGHTVQILDLYRTELQQDFLRFEEPQDMVQPDPVRTKMQEYISWADELIIIHPLWWFDAPAILKNWFDQNFTSGFAYKYTEKTILMPLKLLKGKTARIFITADGPGWFYALVRPFSINWRIGRLGFCGIKVKTLQVLTRKFKKTPVQLETWLKGVYEIGKSS